MADDHRTAISIAVSEHAVEKVHRALLDLATCAASDQVKIVALEAFRGATTISGVSISGNRVTMPSSESQKDSSD